MGVDLGSVVEKEEISLKYLAGRKIGIDSFNILYQFLSSIRSRDGTPLMDSKGRVTSHLTGLLYRTANLVEEEIKPVFVFDGKPIKLKEKTRLERKKTRTEAKKKYEKAKKEGKEKDMRKYAQQALKLTGEMIEESKELIKLMGFPVVVAPHDGEAQIAVMCKSGDLYACGSQDFDALLFGSPRLVRNLTITGKRKLPGKDVYVSINTELIELKRTLEALGLNRKKLVWMGILLGTDFNDKIPGVGPKTALKLVKKHDSIKDLLNGIDKGIEFDFEEIENIFLKPEHAEDYSIEFSKPNLEKIKKFLCDQRSFSEDRVEKAVDRIIVKAEQKGEQSRLDKWG